MARSLTAKADDLPTLTRSLFRNERTVWVTATIAVCLFLLISFFALQ